MALLEWRSDFETGVSGVDSEHRELIELINKAHEQIKAAASKASISNHLGEIFACISAHFALEESIMRKHAYDHYTEHKSDHEKLLDDIRDIMDDFEADKYADCDEVLSTVIRDWFVNHFKTMDARLHTRLGV